MISKRALVLLGLPLVLGCHFRPGPGPIVYRVPGMEEVTIHADQVYREAPGSPPLGFDLYLPKGETPRSGWPAVVLIHGGPIPGEVRPKDWPAYESFGRVVAASGVAAVTFNYRYLSKERLAEAVSDLDTLLECLRARAADLKIDPGRLGLWAFSGGGFQLAAGLRDRPPSLRCLLSFYAFLDAESSRFSPLKSLQSGGEKPIPPIFIARMGRDDPQITRSVDRFVEEARRLSAPVEVADYPEGLHGFDFGQDTAESREIIARAVAFAKRHLFALPAQ